MLELREMEGYMYPKLKCAFPKMGSDIAIPKRVTDPISMLPAT
jgi:hypothetical protein